MRWYSEKSLTLSFAHFSAHIFALHRGTTQWKNQSAMPDIAENICALEKSWDKTRLAWRGPEKSLRLRCPGGLSIIAQGWKGEGHKAHPGLESVDYKQCHNPREALLQQILAATKSCWEFRHGWWFWMEQLPWSDHVPESDCYVNPSLDSCKQLETNKDMILGM